MREQGGRNAARRIRYVASDNGNYFDIIGYGDLDFLYKLEEEQNSRGAGEIYAVSIERDEQGRISSIVFNGIY